MRDAAFCLLFTVLLAVTQQRSGAFSADLASDPDEPAHAVTSLVVRDYLAQAFSHNPMRFASDFYAHYPKVALGHWPPLFYCAEGIWMLLAGRSRAALLLFVLLCGAALICSVYFEVRRRSSTVAALASVAVLMGAKTFQQMLCGVHPDILLALAIFWATVHCGEFMLSGSRRSRNYFLAFTVAALLVHGRGAVLFLVPLALLPLRSRIVKWKWITAGTAVLLLMLLPPLMRQSMHLSWSSVLPHTREFTLSTVYTTGYLATALALIGMVLVFRKGPQRQFWAAMAALAGCSLVFYLLVPVPWDPRFYLVSALTFAVLAGGGVQVILERVSIYPAALRIGLSAASIAWMAWAAVHVAAKPDSGYGRMVQNCLLCGNDVALMAGDPRDEGALIVEASLSDPQRIHTVLRSSKTLEISTWSGYTHSLRFASSSEVLHALDDAHVSLLVVQKDCPRAHVVQLRAALAGDAADWQLAPWAPAANGIEIYRRSHALDATSH